MWLFSTAPSDGRTRLPSGDTPRIGSTFVEADFEDFFICIWVRRAEMKVSTFTDTYLPTINGATYTVNLWKQKWNEGRGEMTVTYPSSRQYTPDDREYPVRSLPFPFYDGVKLGLPLGAGLSGLLRVLTDTERSYRPGSQYLATTGDYLRRGPAAVKQGITAAAPTGNGGPAAHRRALSRANPNGNHVMLPEDVRDTDLVHVHGPFTMGMAGAALAQREDVPLVVNYHTPTDEYVKYITSNDAMARQLKRVNNWWEKKYLRRADVIVTPSEEAKDWLYEKGIAQEKVTALQNGIDVDFFSPTDSSDFEDEWELSGPVIGYCGRHGYEKCLDDVVAAAARMPDVDVVLVGDGPARSDLIAQAEELGADNVRFPGFIERERLPEFYSALDAFVFPSDSETEGIVAMEATACGTPVVGADARGLKNTVKHGVNGYRYPAGDLDALASAVDRALDRREELSQNCLEMRDEMKVDRTLDEIEAIYRDLV